MMLCTLFSLFFLSYGLCELGLDTNMTTEMSISPASSTTSVIPTEKASSLLEKTMLKFMLAHVTHASEYLKLDKDATDTMSTFVNTATAKRVVKRMKEYKRPLSNVHTDLGLAESVREFLRTLASDKLPPADLFPQALKDAAGHDAAPSNCTDDDLLGKWSEFCKNARNMCLIIRAYSVMDQEFLGLLDKVFDVVVGELGNQNHSPETMPNIDIQQLMMALLMKGDINIGQVAASMSKMSQRDPEMISECLGTVISILKESGVDTPDIGLLQNIGSMGLGGAAAAVPSQPAIVETAATPTQGPPTSLTRLLDNLAKVDSL